MRAGQQQSNKFSQLFFRLEKLRVELDATWDQLAEKMGVSRSLFFQVKRGNCGFSARNMAKLLNLEREAGIEPKADVDHFVPTPEKAKTALASRLLPRPPAMRTFSERLRWLRQDCFRLTIQAFASRLKTGQGYVHELESEKKQHPSKEFAERISREFNVQSEWLLTGRGRPFPHAPKFYDFPKLTPSDVAFSSLAPHYSLLSSGLLVEALQELVGLLTGDNLDEIGSMLDDVILLGKELRRRSKLESGGREPVEQPKEYPRVETVDSALVGERTIMLQEELAAAKKVIERDGFIADDPIGLERAVQAGVPIESLRMRIGKDPQGNPIEPPSIAELSEAQKVVLSFWRDYWELKKRGHDIPEPPNLGAGPGFFSPKDANVLSQELKHFINHQAESWPAIDAAAIEKAARLADQIQADALAGIQRKPEARQPAVPARGPKAHTHQAQDPSKHHAQS